MQEKSAKFANRNDAGRVLARELAGRGLADPVVLALPRGGVPVAFEIAKELRAPMDFTMVKKLGAPGHAEYAIGAIVDGEHPEVVVDNEAVAYTAASQAYITRLIAASLKEIRRRRSAYGLDWPIDLKGRTAILVDDGIATGSTAKAALKAIRKAAPSWIILAVPVAPPNTLGELSSLYDEVICPMRPCDFHAVGTYYDDFGQTSDIEVVRYLELSRDFGKEARH